MTGSNSMSSGDTSGDVGNGGRRGRVPADDEGGRQSRLWPILITLGLLFVILVNGIFIYIAVKGADQVVPSYITEER
jgi:hypothetical protein